jgi:hypothetical protein
MAAIEIEARQTTSGAGIFTSTNTMQPIDVVLSTDGGGLWSEKSKQVRVIGLALGYANEEGDFGELRAFFDLATWDTMRDGLIYTDDLFEKELQAHLNGMGLAGGDVGYSEQGMQGDNFVSLDVGGEFISSWRRIFG